VTAPTGTTVEPDSEEVVALIQRARKLAEARDIAAARRVPKGLGRTTDIPVICSDRRLVLQFVEPLAGGGLG